MTGNALRLGRILGIELKLDYSWFIIFILVVWSLASHYFPTAHPDWPAGTYWAMGAITALLFFASVVAHELAHSFVSQASGVPVRNITLFIFGGAAQISEEPRSARAEFLMALAGPVTSLVIAALFGLLWLVSLSTSPSLHALAGWLAWINVSLAVFNLIPGFPLDGGRVFRALVWAVTGNLRLATQIASGLGRLVAYGFIFLGLWQIEVMTTDCPRIARWLALEALVNRVVLPSGRRCFPVMEDDQILGLLTLHRIKKVPRERWATTQVEEVMIPRDQLKSVGPDDDLSTVFERMTAENVNQFPVMENGRLLGMIARDNMLAFLRTRAELGI
jgi:Zn-dependent protease